MCRVLVLLLFLSTTQFYSSSAQALECPQPLNLKQIEAAGGEELHSWCEDNGKRQGPYEVFAVDGGLKIQAQYSTGQLDGSFKRFYPNGKLHTEGTYAKGLMQGNWTRYKDDGTVLDRVEWKDDRPMDSAVPDVSLDATSDKKPAVKDSEQWRIRGGYVNSIRDDQNEIHFVGAGFDYVLFNWRRWVGIDFFARLMPEWNPETNATVSSGSLFLSFDLLRRWTNPFAFSVHVGRHASEFKYGRPTGGIGARYYFKPTAKGRFINGVFAEFTNVEIEDRPPSNAHYNADTPNEGLDLFFLGLMFSFY